MDRREFLAGLTTAAILGMLDSRYLEARAQMESGAPQRQPLERRTLGRTDLEVSVIGFGAILLRDRPASDAPSFVAEAIDRTVNFFDVAPEYGDSESKLGPALKPYRDKVVLACKTARRDADGARAELERSLRLLQTDHFDLYQLHHVERPEEVERLFAPGGAMEVLTEAKEAGKVRYLGFSAHSEEAALALLDRFDFDTCMFPLSFNIWWNGNFGPEVHKRLVEDNRGILAIKAMSHGQRRRGRGGNNPGAEGVWNTWYEPLRELDRIGLALRFTANLPVHSIVPPGNWELHKLALDFAQSGALTPLNEDETKLLRALADELPPVFQRRMAAVPPAAANPATTPTTAAPTTAG